MKLGWMFLGLVFPVMAFANPSFVKVKGYDLEVVMTLFF